MKFLGIDIGTGGSRAVVIDEDARIAASAMADHAAIGAPHTGWAEQSPDDWWRAAREVIRAVLNSVPAEDFGGVSFSGQMHGSVLLDDRDSVIRPALLWCDQRTAAQVKEIGDEIADADLIPITGNAAVTGCTLPKLLWVRENEPENWKCVASFLLPKDYIRLMLSGEKATDVADASGTLMFDVGRRTWSSDVLERFGLDRTILPSVVESVVPTGVVSSEGAAATGMLAGTPIYAGAGDNAAGAIGAGIVKPGCIGVTIGTSGVVFAVTDMPKVDLIGRAHSLCHAIPGRWHMTGVTLSAGYSLKWFRDNFACECGYDEIAREAASVEPGADGLIWLPYLMGERTPHMDADARAAFIGLNASHTRAHLARAVMEGVAFSLRESIDIFRGLGIAIDEIRLGGGGARSPLWRQIQADVFDQPVTVLNADEGAAYGAAILAAVGVGAWPSVDAACDQAVTVKEIIEPDRASSAVLGRQYQTYRSLYPLLREAFHRPN